ncbi:isopentenyl diphosphate delta-isomerase I [Tanacetum coccineum]
MKGHKKTTSPTSHLTRATKRHGKQRSATKVTFPLVWTNTCCSHPLYRESELIEENFLGVRNAAQRKLLDELGIPSIDLSVNEFIPLVDYLLFIVRDVSMDPNPDEVVEVKYIVVDNFLFKWWDHVENGSLLEASDMKTIHNL